MTDIGFKCRKSVRGHLCGLFAVLTRQKSSFKVIFYMISELFYCIKNPESSRPSQVPNHKKSRVELTGENYRQLENVYTYISLEGVSSIFD